MSKKESKKGSFTENSKKYYGGFPNSELFIGLTGAIGTDLNTVASELSSILSRFGYKPHIIEDPENTEVKSHRIKISKDIINHEQKDENEYLDLNKKTFPKRFYTEDKFYEDSKGEPIISGYEPKYQCSERLMDWGDHAREISKNNAILAYMVVEKIREIRGNVDNWTKDIPKRAYIIQGLKRPEEVTELRRIYGNGFFLIGVYLDKAKRKEYLIKKGMADEEACEQINRDEDDKERNPKHGQNTSNTFELSDFFINQEWDIKPSLTRICHLLFGDPHITPTFDEYAMYVAYASSLMAMDLARTVGAVISTPQNDIVATGCNEAPKFGGGIYQTQHNKGHYWEYPNGRDKERGRNSGKEGIDELSDEILKFLKNKFDEINDKNKDENNKGKEFPDWLDAKLLGNSPLKGVIEYFRTSHAEVNAILSCTRNGISTQNCTLYCTTMPCHECGKHIIGVGITRVVFIEPYAKSRTLSHHSECTHLGFDKIEGKVRFEPFVGVGPRRFLDLFSMSIGSGYPTRRQDKQGYPIEFEEEAAFLRTPLYPISYLDREHLAEIYSKELAQQKKLPDQQDVNFKELFLNTDE